jgi:hypothetical protein
MPALRAKAAAPSAARAVERFANAGRFQRAMLHQSSLQLNSLNSTQLRDEKKEK